MLLTIRKLVIITVVMKLHNTNGIDNNDVNNSASNNTSDDK